MLFNSLTFFVFLPVVLVGYYRLSLRGQNLWLLIASCVFYGWWDYRFLGLMAFSAFIDYFTAMAIEDSQDPVRRKRLLLLSLCLNLGILGFFKYFNFFVDSAVDLLAVFGVSSGRPVLEVILPVGISFYTFQALSYTIDVYKKELKACRDPILYGLYITYFPQLVAGPIERATALLPQLEQPRRVHWDDIREGLVLCLIGYFKKVGIADSLGPLADMRFQNPGLASGFDLLLGLYFFCFQIYCDFSGYSDIARGISRFFGVKLMINFNQPYFSSTITEFWRRWHISLSSWLRDYLYITLGGNRGSQFNTYRNLMLTMLLGGLWHGASWTFVVWGGLHGLYLAVHKLWLEKTGGPPVAESFWRTLLKMIVTFHLVALTWIFFRAPDFSTAWLYVSRLITWAPAQVKLFSWNDRFAIISILFLFFFDWLQVRGKEHVAILRFSWFPRALLYAVLLIAIFVLGGLESKVPFIYFQF